MGGGWENREGEKLRQEFLQVLASRRRRLVPLRKISGQPIYRPYLQRQLSMPPNPEMNSCSLGDAPDVEMEIEEENFFLTTEAGEQGRMPVLLMRPAREAVEGRKRPTLVLLHSTGRSKEIIRPFMESFAVRGYVAVAIDSRYHGERADSKDAYRNALVRAWKTGEEMPFIFDTVWDLIKLVDYLCTRKDVDSTRIGMLGVSLGGMHAWFAAFADPRIAIVVPIIGVQSFSWAVVNDRWHARVESIPHVFEAAKEDLGKSAIDSETVASVWRHIAPGLMDRFDSQFTIPAIAPRPILILNGQEDPRCPVAGLEATLSRAAEVYDSAGVPHHFQFKAEEGIPHHFCDDMRYLASVWIDKQLKPGT